MKKIIVLLLSIVCCAIITSLHADAQCTRFTKAFTAGYAFKSDCAFNQVYGTGMVSAVTGDWCYYAWDMAGIGAKVSYWRAKGRTTSLNQHTLLQEVPVTLYARARKQFECGSQLYASLGAGVLWVKENSYLGTVKKLTGVGEVETGFLYPIYRCCSFTGAFRYLFPYQKVNSSHKVALGGYELRGGVAFSF